MHYLDAKMAKSAIIKMKNFHQSLLEVHNQYDLNFFQDLGRRNILMSRPQEVFFCEEIKKKFPKASSDGRTGQPDILVPEFGKELECKITTKRKGGSWAFQADYATLARKGKCDFLYVCCDKEFENFGVFYFRDLTTDDFKPPASGSRGKSRLLIRNCIDRCESLVGSIFNRNQIFIMKANAKLLAAQTMSEEKAAQKSLNYWQTTPNSYTIKLDKI
jgi:hypothetical protein|tara:strand:- start:4388 stop:5038 length:651 start_codon:yes stop_codon:yes gene_type:complete